jgi:non-ribosomal peptide synthetase component F
MLLPAPLQVFLSKLCVVEGDTNSWLPLLRVPMMDNAEERLVLEGFNQSRVPYDPATLVHGMFAENARRHPEAPCLIFQGCVYSYAEVGQSQFPDCIQQHASMSS